MTGSSFHFLRGIRLTFSVLTFCSLTITLWAQTPPDSAPDRELQKLVERAEGTRLAVQTVQVAGKEFLNRDYAITEVPRELLGKSRYAFEGGNGERIVIRFRQPAVMFAVFEFNDTGKWSFADGKSPQEHGWHVWRAEAYSGSSNPVQNGQPHRVPIWFQEFRSGEELSHLPGWWLCLGIVDLETASRLQGFQAGLFTAQRPIVPVYSHALEMGRIRSLNVPVFNTRDDIRHWQDQQRKLFLQRMVYPYQGNITITANEVIQRKQYNQQEFCVSLNGDQLFRYFRLEPHSDARHFPTMICFMGHGRISQMLDEEQSYQHACAASFAKSGYLVYVMENIGMGPGPDIHRDLDQVLRLEGYGWYSLLFAHQRILFDKVFSDPMVEASHVGVTGVSTGGFLALSAAAMEDRIAAASVQGIFGSMRVSFIQDRKNHCLCGAIPNLLPEFDLPELALLVAPRPLQFINGSQDGFPPAEAERCLKLIAPIYRQSEGDTPRFDVPIGGHAYYFEPALEFFQQALK